MTLKKRIHVVAGIIFNEAGDQVLIAKRPDHLHKGGYWEFPGGKVEKGEGELSALSRELKEELNITFSKAEPFQALSYDYPEKLIDLSFWSVFGINDEVQALEQQQWAWVDLSALSDFTFPEANQPIVDALSLL